MNFPTSDFLLLLLPTFDFLPNVSVKDGKRHRIETCKEPKNMFGALDKWKWNDTVEIITFKTFLIESKGSMSDENTR